jgi:hypothetical protein
MAWAGMAVRRTLALTLVAFGVATAIQVAPPRETLVITVANTIFLDRAGGVCRLLESALQNRIEIEVLGLGEPWHGFTTKLQHVLRRLSDNDIGDDTIVMFVDAYDVALVHPMPFIVEKFKALDKEVVFGGECTCRCNSRRHRAPQCLPVTPGTLTCVTGLHRQLLSSGQCAARAL